MFAVKEGKVKINDREVRTYERAVVEEGAALHVMAGTTGYKGNGRKAGGRVYLRLECFCGDFHFDQVTDEDGEIIGIEIAACGDESLDAVAKALRFAKETIDDQRFGKNE